MPKLPNIMKPDSVRWIGYISRADKSVKVTIDWIADSKGYAIPMRVDGWIWSYTDGTIIAEISDAFRRDTNRRLKWFAALLLETYGEESEQIELPRLW